jgi:DNA sulfur modification protein DndC
MANKDNRAESVFTVLGYKDTIAGLLEEIRALYREDDKPWIIGYSGGKDSTAVLQLVWSAIRTLDVSEREKPIYVISTDTLVENPVVAAWVNRSLISMADAATEQQMPVVPHRLTPELKDSFWVNLIGKGYPAPRPKFRWCTERLKINPSNAFITGVARKSGETILVLGTRKAESSARARNMAKHERLRTRDRLSPSSSLPNCLIFSPIEDWSNDDVWLFLMQTSNPWGYNNKDLLTMYQGASPDGECPLVVDATTPSCGDSRFGCWVCTMVDKDKSMHAMIQNDDEKEWMLPLLQLRNELDIGDDRHLRDFRRMNGLVQIFKGRNIPGPYTQKARERWVRRVLETETWIRQNAPESVRDIQLITDDELKEIRRIWVTEKHEIEDTLPQIYREVTGRDFPTDVVDARMRSRLFGRSAVKTRCTSS